MEIEVQHPSFTIRKLRVRTASLLAGPKLLVDGQVISGYRGSFQIRDDEGLSRNIMLKYSMFDPVPNTKIDGTQIFLAPSFTWHEYVWIGIPILLVFVGGAIGGMVGAGAVYANSRIFRSDRPTPTKYLLSSFISIGAVITYIMLAIVIRNFIYGK